tara:strand:+ start:521 stop:1672 length:1152 start_codon:yes stop_codon:yes gene_type:complete
MSVTKKKSTRKSESMPEYDIHIVIPVSACKKKFADRIDFIKDYGLQNYKNTKFYVTLLIGTEDIKVDQKDWPFEIETASGKFDHPAPKIYQYFADYPIKQAEKARWIAKIDDDALTDVDGLVFMLDRDYEWKGDYYICTDVAPPYGAPYYFEYRRILIDLGYGHWMCRNNSKSDKVDLVHEIEGCMMSQPCLKKILNHPDAIELLKRSDIEDGGFGDHCLAFGARMCKIYPLDSPFLTRWPCVNEFSVFGGRYFHVHHVSPDQPAYHDLQGLMNEKETSLSLKDIKITKTKILNKKWLFGRVGWGNLCNGISFDPDGKILNPCWRNEDSWEITKQGKLVFKDVEGRPSTIFDKHDPEYNYIEGDFVLEPEKKIKHYLKLIAKD